MTRKPAAALCAACDAAPVDPAYRPFCSKRCADLDLSRWMKGVYAIPGRPAEDAEEAPSASRGLED